VSFRCLSLIIIIIIISCQHSLSREMVSSGGKWSSKANVVRVQDGTSLYLLDLLFILLFLIIQFLKMILHVGV